MRKRNRPEPPAAAPDGYLVAGSGWISRDNRTATDPAGRRYALPPRVKSMLDWQDLRDGIRPARTLLEWLLGR
jgi:hypothetical protein